MNREEADRLAANLLAMHGEEESFEVSLGDEHDYLMLEAAFARLRCRTGPDGEFFRLKVYPGQPN